MSTPFRRRSTDLRIKSSSVIWPAVSCLRKENAEQPDKSRGRFDPGGVSPEAPPAAGLVWIGRPSSSPAPAPPSRQAPASFKNLRRVLCILIAFFAANDRAAKDNASYFEAESMFDVLLAEFRRLLRRSRRALWFAIKFHNRPALKVNVAQRGDDSRQIDRSLT
jgi:hypothetical protein